jgi:queuine/archaeosine tRNA-ribosyltransferase
MTKKTLYVFDPKIEKILNDLIGRGCSIIDSKESSKISRNLKKIRDGGNIFIANDMRMRKSIVALNTNCKLMKEKNRYVFEWF